MSDAREATGRNRARDAYDYRVLMARDMLRDIAALVDDHDPCGEGVNWGHVGDMAHVVDELSCVRWFLGYVDND